MMTPSRTFIIWARCVGLVWIVGGIFMALAAGSRVLTGWGSQQWPHVTGQIVKSDIYPVTKSTGEAAFYKVHIAYAYSPPSPNQYGYAFQGNRISYHGFVDPADDSYTLLQAERLVGKYSVGKSVPVYYSQSNLNKAVLQPGMSFGTFDGTLGGLALVLFGSLLLLKFSTMPTNCG